MVRKLQIKSTEIAATSETVRRGVYPRNKGGVMVRGTKKFWVNVLVFHIVLTLWGSILLYGYPYIYNHPYLGSGYSWFQVAIIADPHIGDRYIYGDKDYSTPGWDDDPLPQSQEGELEEALRACVDWINSNRYYERIKYVFVLGDLTDSGEKSEQWKAYEILDELLVPWIPLLGNHDVWPYVSSSNKAPEEQSDYHFHNIFTPQYDYLSVVLKNFTKCPAPDWNFEVDPDHNSYFQNFAFDSDYGDWHFMCLDFNARDDALNGEGVGGDAEVFEFNVDDEISAIKVYNSDSRGVILYDDVDYGDWSETFFGDDPNIGDNWIGDRVSSVRIVGNCSVTLYDKDNYQSSGALDVSGNISRLGNYGFNDRASSISVDNGFMGSYVILYEDYNYGGDSEVIIRDDATFYENKVGNDRVSSVKLVGCATCRLYRDTGYGGGYISITQSGNLPSSWNDEASSIRVYNITSRGIVLYGDYDYKGRQQTFFYNDANLSGDYIGDNATSSVHVVGGANCTLYDGTNYYDSGRLTLTSSCSNLYQYDFNDKTRSIDVSNTYKNGRVVLYRGTSYSGTSETFIYNDDNLGDNQIGSDVAKSIRIYPGGSGCYTRLYEHNGYGGHRLELHESNPDLSENLTYRWWRDHLRNYPNKQSGNILLFAHHPIYVNDIWAFTGGEKDAVTDVLYPYRNSIGAQFCGHVHGHWSWDQEYDVKHWNDEVICRGYFVDAVKEWVDYGGFMRLVRLYFNSTVKEKKID
jgi:hypothetical protein